MALRTKKRGATYIEAVIATLVVAVALMGCINLFALSYQLTQRNTDKGLGYNVGRDAVEQVRASGFYNATEGNTITYYSSSGGGPFTTQGTNKFRVTVNITSDKFTTVGTTTTVADTALRTVTVIVTDLSTSTTVFSTATTLARAGV